jgi:2-methylcitrate dehydratase PrpD
MNGLTDAITQFIDKKSIVDFPDGTLEKSKKIIADTVAAILAGSNSEVSVPLVGYLKDGPIGKSRVLGTAHRTTDELAALLNGTFGHALDFDDVLVIMPAHPSAVILSALLAYASASSTKVSGRSLLESYVLGIEVGGHLGAGITIEHYNRGFHATGTLAIFSAVAALAKLRGLDQKTMRMAFGIACSMASGVQRNTGTMTKSLHTGMASQKAVAAISLALHGLTSADDALESSRGFFGAYGTDKSDPDVALKGLGSPWILDKPGIALKKFPCAYRLHRGIDGLLVLKEKHKFLGKDVLKIECRIAKGAKSSDTLKADVQTGLQGKFNMTYALAVAALDGSVSIKSFTDDNVRRADIRWLSERITVVESDACRGEDPLFETQSAGTRGFVEVEVQLTNGVSDCIRVMRPPGHPTRELSWAELEAKFIDCAAFARIDSNNVGRAFQAFRDLENVADINEVLPLVCL